MKKYSGILCHITCLPSEYGVGDLGPSAYRFIDHLKSANQSYWQILPIGNTDVSGCPYATDSAFGIAEFLLSPEKLISDFNLPETFLEQIKNSNINDERVNFLEAKSTKIKLLELAFTQFVPDSTFSEFIDREIDWIESYAIFRTFLESRGEDWTQWPRFKDAKSSMTEFEKERMLFFQFSQYIVMNQLLDLKNYANKNGIKLIGDLPIFVSYFSMDVWKSPEDFILNNETLRLELETGAAPDAFSKTGQKWGTPIYNFNAQEENKFAWWKTRLSFLKRYFDVIRIDHFRGFCATWVSRVSEVDGTNGFWFPGPGEKLFKALTDTPEIIAEDLGVITPDVEALRDQFKFPGMRVLEFMLGDDDNIHKIKNYIYNSIAYSATHDCDTLVGWLKNLTEAEIKEIKTELNLKTFDHWELLTMLMNSKSEIVIIQIQDVLGLDSSARFNYPGIIDARNWTWRLTSKSYAEINFKKLKELTNQSGRSNCRSIK